MPSILVVDDDRATRHLLQALLTRNGMKTVVARDGSDALKQLRTKRFQLMLLDVWMPRMNGLELLARLKARRAKPRVIVMTSDDTPDTLLRAVRDQAFQYIRKPVDAQTLLAAVRGVLDTPDDVPPIEVTSARPNWVELLVPCTRDAVERIQTVMTTLGADLPAEILESVTDAFRELLMNAVEWGGKLDPSRKVRIACVRTNRVVMYRIADPGPGFKLADLDHAAITHDEDPIAHMRVRAEKGLRPGGFGLLMVRAKVDELVYNERQNEVIFMKYLKEEP
jgi:CheY-like chemotaxis protein/anti-sigma regulatory factor (Ser/Thr protein kinase)